MDLKGLCVPIKNLFLFSTLTFLLSACTSNSEPQPYILDKSRTSSCQNEIQQSISKLIQAKNLKISEGVFSKESSLHLTNKKDSALSPSPIFNDLGGKKTLFLYKQNGDVYIGLVNEKKDILKTKKLKECH